MINYESKLCSSCFVEKPVDTFSKSNKSWCLDCWNNYQKKYRASNKDKIKKAKNKYNNKNKVKISKYYKNLAEEKKEIRRARTRNYMKLNRAQMNIYMVSKRKTDLNTRLAHCLRSRLRDAVKSKGADSSKVSAVRSLGCSLSELRIYLENKFSPGMSWKNYGKDGWHIDHIIPLASFGLSHREELLRACHYTNLQPLWAEDNLRKGARH